MFDLDICLLSAKFIIDHGAEKFPELMFKAMRPYTCLLIDTHEGYMICIPFRSHIKHKQAFLFRGTERSQKDCSGLDYTKIALVRDMEYISDAVALVDKDEYNEVMKHAEQIAKEASQYVMDYRNHLNGIKRMHPREFQRRYQYSTLPYFHDLLNIP